MKINDESANETNRTHSSEDPITHVIYELNGLGEVLKMGWEPASSHRTRAGAVRQINDVLQKTTEFVHAIMSFPPKPELPGYATAIADVLALPQRDALRNSHADMMQLMEPLHRSLDCGMRFPRTTLDVLRYPAEVRRRRIA